MARAGFSNMDVASDLEEQLHWSSHKCEPEWNGYIIVSFFIGPLICSDCFSFCRFRL